MSEVIVKLPDILQAAPRIMALRHSPHILLVVGPNKHGKTECVAHLPNCRIVDLEYVSGTDFLSNLPYEPFRPNTVEEFEAFCKACREHQPYQFVAFDPLDKIETWADERAAAEYLKTPIGAAYKAKGAWDGKRASTIPSRDDKGSPGWAHVRKHTDELLLMTAHTAPHVIWVAHQKATYGEQIENKDIKANEVSSEMVDLMGKNKALVVGTADAFAKIIRNPANTNQVLVTFRYRGGAVNGGGGSRCAYLDGQDFVLSSKDPETGKITTFWEKIYPELAK